MFAMTIKIKEDSMDERLKKIIDNSASVVFFGGAGVSTESNIPDFRSEKGLYSAQQQYGYSPEQMLSHSFFVRHMKTFYDYYKKNLIYLDAEPNKAHKALAYLEKQGKLKAVITQNIDGLHQKAGSKRVYELHGSILRNFCVRCGKFHSAEFVKGAPGVPKCSCGGTVKPDVVLYEESLDQSTIEKTVNAIADADLLIVAGTSLTVYPAAGLIRYYGGKRLVLINRDETPYDSYADLVFHDSLGSIFSKL
jgi:NAD-dependent deacetylase